MVNYTITKDETILLELPKTVPQRINGNYNRYVTDPKSNNIIDKQGKQLAAVSLVSVAIPLTTHFTENDNIELTFNDIKGTEHIIKVPTNYYNIQDELLEQYNTALIYDAPNFTAFIQALTRTIYTDDAVIKKLEKYEEPSNVEEPLEDGFEPEEE